MDQVFKDDFKLGKNFKMGKKTKLTWPIKVKKIHMKLWDKFFKDDFKLGKDFRMGEAGTISFIIFVISKSTIPI